MGAELTSLSSPSQRFRLFALGQRVEVFDGARWFTAEILAMILAETGLFYLFEGWGFGGCLPHSAIRPAATGDAVRRIAISAAGIDYKRALPRWLSGGPANSNAGAAEP